MKMAVVMPLGAVFGWAWAAVFWTDSPPSFLANLVSLIWVGVSALLGVILDKHKE